MKYDGKNPTRGCRCRHEKAEHCGEDGACTIKTMVDESLDYCPCTKFDPTRQVKIDSGSEVQVVTVSGDRQVTIFQLGDTTRVPTPALIKNFHDLVVKAYEDPDFVIVMPYYPIKVTQVVL